MRFNGGSRTASIFRSSPLRPTAICPHGAGDVHRRRSRPTRSWKARGGREGDVVEETVAALREQLESCADRLRTIREENEAANEELRAANEELQSINEEYRSTAEELETSKEELQSINEELQTVNSELKLKLDSVSRAHSDLQNLMAATDFGTLFLDSDAAHQALHPARRPSCSTSPADDEGRPITDFTHQLDYDGLPEDARKVLHDLAPIEREVQSTDGRWYRCGCAPIARWTTRSTAWS